MSEENATTFWDELIGCQLSSVEFVQDYLQLRFDGPSINVINPHTVNADGKEITSWASGFRDLLCGQITKIVENVSFQEEKSLTIRFDDQSQIAISLRPEDYSTPEAIHAIDFKNNGWLVI